MSDDGFDPWGCDVRHLTPQQWTELRRNIFSRARDDRNRVIRQLVAVAFSAIRAAWRRRRLRQEARAALRSMTDYELRDIGVSRSGIEAAIRRNERPADDLVRQRWYRQQDGSGEAIRPNVAMCGFIVVDGARDRLLPSELRRLPDAVEAFQRQDRIRKLIGTAVQNRTRQR